MSNESWVYALKDLPYHLAKIRRGQRLLSLLTDLSFMASKAAVVGPLLLIRDYDLFATHLRRLMEPAEDELGLKILQDALRLSEHVLLRDPDQLPGQLIARLSGDEAPEIRHVLEQARSFRGPSWLQPLRPVLTSPRGPLVNTLRGHEYAIHGVAISPNGRSAISGSVDWTLRVWNLETGEMTRTLKGHGDHWVNAVAFLRDGRHAISASEDRTLKVWDLDNGQCLCTLRGHSGPVWDVAVTSDDRLAISASADGTLRVWDLANAVSVRTLRGHDDRVWSVALTPDGRRAISGSGDRSLKLWDLADGSLLQTLNGHGDQVNCVAVSHDGRCAISASRDRTVKLWDLGTGESLTTLTGHHDEVSCVAWAPDDRQVISGSIDTTILVWDVESSELVSTLRGHSEHVWSLAVSTESHRMVSGSEDLQVKVWDLDSLDRVQEPPDHDDSLWAVGISADGSVALSGSRDGDVKVWDLASGAERFALSGLTGFVKRIAIDSARGLAVVGSEEGVFKVWELAKGREQWSGEGSFLGLVTTQQRRQAACVQREGGVCLLDLERGDTLLEFDLRGGPIVAVGSWVAGLVDSRIQAWNVKTGECWTSLAVEAEKVNDLAITPDGRYAVTASGELGLELLALRDSNRRVLGRPRDASSVRTTRDGRRAVSVSSKDTHNDTLEVWDLKSGKVLSTLVDHTTGIYGMWDVVLTPDDKHAICASHDQTLKVWDLAGGRLTAAFTGESSLLSCAVADDSVTMVAGTMAGQVYLLRLIDGEVQSCRAEARPARTYAAPA